MSFVRTGLAVIASLGVVVHGGMASAQTTGNALRSAQARSVDMFARDRAVAVRDRPHPEYEALGVPLGMFTLYPRLQLDVEYNDNIYATASGAEDDVVFHIKPEVALESGWSRHMLNAYARGTINRYDAFDSENSEDFGLGAAGRLDITRAANLAGGVDYAELTEPRTSSNAPASTAEPIQYDMAQAYLAASRVSGRLKLSARGDYRTFDYKDGLTVGGLPVDQDNRDRDVSSLSGRADYAVSPATAFFVQVTGNERAYDVASTLAAPNRDSSGYEALAGVNFELGAVARGEIAAGYIKQDFDETAYSDIDGFGARAQVQWFPTDLTTVTVGATRTIEDAGVVGSGGYLSSGVSFAVDHELLRNVILSGGLTYSTDEYNGIDRDDDRFSASVGGTYLLNRNIGLSLMASHLEQSSDGLDAGSDFDVNRVIFSVVTQF